MAKKPKAETYSWNESDESNIKKPSENTKKKTPKTKKERTKMLKEETDLPDHDYMWGEALDAAFFTALTVRLTTPIRQLPAFRMGLINAQGYIIREPMTRQERRALSQIDRIALFMRQSMGGRISAIMNMYRKQRMSPKFIQAAARALSLRFNKYYDMKTAFYERPFPQAITGGSGATPTSPGKPHG